MPEDPARAHPAGRAGPLDTVVQALHGLDRELDGLAIADLLWLAAQRRADPGGAAGEAMAGEAGPQAPPTPPKPPTRLRRTGRERRTPLYESPGGAPAEPGEPARGVSLPRAVALPRARELARALRPLKRPWRMGLTPQLDMDRTVSDYARSGELVPAFTPAPERWFDLTVVVDRSPTMAVWNDMTRELLRVLSRSGAFRTLRVRGVGTTTDRPEEIGPQGRRTREGGMSSTGPRPLTMVISDCAAAAWQEGAMWERLHAWADAMPAVLVNPLPVKIWRATGLDLSAVRVTSPGPPGVRNTRLCFSAPALLEEALPEATAAHNGWRPFPIVSLSPHAVASWSRMLMRADPEGCEALLLPGPGVVAGERRRAGPLPADPDTLTQAYLHRASPGAARLAVLCSPYPYVSIPLLRLVQRALVPEATPADMAELVVGGLVTVYATGDDGAGAVLRFRDGVRERLARRLGARDAWRLHDALGRFITENTAAAARFPALVPDTDGDAVLPADLLPFADASALTLRALGVPGADERSARASEQVRTPAGGRPGGTEAAPQPSPPAGEAAEHRPYFFLSYAHTPRYRAGDPGPDMWVERFFRDLNGHVTAMTDLPPGVPAGYMDRELRSGEGWSERLGQVLATCRVFVPLYSPRYFASETCGQEWYAFAQRAINHQARHNRLADGIVPALWVPVRPDQLPAPAAGLQFSHRAFGDRYVTDGLYGLIKLRMFAEEYERAVYELAKRVVSVADSAGIGPGRPVDHRAVPSAFGRTGDGPRPIRVTVAAPTCHDLPDGRDPAYYGDTPQQWNPYHPEVARPIAGITEDLLRSLNYRPTVVPFGHGTAAADDVRAPDGPEILLVDPWFLDHQEHRERLAAYDAEHRPWVGVVVPRSPQDLQSRAVDGELTRVLETTMPVTMRQGRAAHRAAVRGVPSMEAFGRILPQVVEAAHQQYLRHAAPAVGRRPDVPRLSTPDPLRPDQP
ncbi:TIR-like protein FxsC [Streptomyces sp. NPDC047821]|uniref:TIR-like protein FxsC n=1 Tax=Streptomyces sp. NPDC047821 TaxID=3365488 RepID=UPI003721DBFC